MKDDFYFLNKEKKQKKDLVEAIITLIILIIFGGVLAFGCGWVEGWFLKIFIGDWIVKGLAIFHLNIDKTQIPLMVATINAIAYIIRTKKTNNK